MAEQTLATLIASMTTNQAIAAEVLSKLGQLVNVTAADVNFNLPSGVVTVPNIAKIQQQAMGSNVGERLTSVEGLSRSFISELARLNETLGLTSSAKTNPFYYGLDLTSATSPDADSGNAFYRAELNRGLRLPYDGYTVRAVDRKLVGSAPKINDWMLANYTVTSDVYYVTPPAASQYLNAYAYRISGPDKEQTKIVNTPIYTHYYGYYYSSVTTNSSWTSATDTYWYWWILSQQTSSGSSSTNSTYSYVVDQNYVSGWQTDSFTYFVPTTINLTGSALGQTWVQKTNRVLLGIKLLCSYVNDYKTAAQPNLYLVECSYGRPDLDKIITSGTMRADSEANIAGANVANITFDLFRPVVITANRNYAFVIETKGEFRVLHGAQTESTGGVFYTQDRRAWEQDIAKDLQFTLLTADFGADATQYIDLPAIELSGGIASAEQRLAVEGLTGTSTTVQVQVNGVWYDLSYLNTITSLPPFTNARLKLTGSQYVFPVLDTVNSAVIAFRPATQGRFIGTTRPAKQKVLVAYELGGYDATFHTFDPGLMVGATRYTPTATTTTVSQDGRIRTLTCTFNLPTSITYVHDVRQSTLNASKTFDINSIIELN